MDREIIMAPYQEDGHNRQTLYETFWSMAEFHDTAKEGANSYDVRSELSDAEHFIRFGWDEHLPRALGIAEGAVSAATEVRELEAFAPVFDVAGDMVDMGRYLGNDPECMVSNPMRQTVASGRVVTLVSMADSNGGGDWLTRGILATALGLALDRLGYASEMWADNFGRSTVNQYQRILVKSTADEIDPARLMFAFGHKAMLRGLAFGTFDGYRTLGPDYEKWFYSYGKPLHRGSATSRTTFFEGLYPPGTVFITGELDAPTPEGMARAVVSGLRGLGILPEVNE